MKTINLLFSACILLVLGVTSACKKNVIEPKSPAKDLSYTNKTLSLAAKPSSGTGTWTKLMYQLPSTSSSSQFSSVMILLSDGTVAVKTTDDGYDFAGNVWLRLTPDATGSYVNGTWSSDIAPMNYTRHDFSSQLLPDGRLYVAGGEYGSGRPTAEIYDPLRNTWTNTSTPPGGIADASSQLLNNGTILQNFVDIKVGSNYAMGCSIYSPAQDNWSPVFYSLNSLNEGHFVQLPDQSILNIDLNGATAERYIPSLGSWVADANPALNIYGPDGEMGAGFLLPSEQVFYMGANGSTIYYTPSNSPSPGIWTAGPPTPGGLGADDAGAAFMVNGKILFALGPAPSAQSPYNPPTSFFEFDYTSNTYTPIMAPNGSATLPYPTYESNFLQLPDGSLLFAAMYSATDFYIYKPAGSQIKAGVPIITGVTQTGNRKYTITGSHFHGLNSGAGYGDDAQNNTNFPIVSLTSGSNVYYARTSNWTLTGRNSVQCTVPANVPPGRYSMTVIVNGFHSAPQIITL